MPYDPYTGQPVTGPAWGPRPPERPYTSQPVIQPSYIPGRTVQDINEVVPQEIPMNGSVALFPTANLSAIYVKGWTQNGTISTVRYVPEVIPAGDPEPDQFQAQILSRLDAMEEALRSQSSKNNKSAIAGKKGSNKEESEAE